MISQVIFLEKEQNWIKRIVAISIDALLLMFFIPVYLGGKTLPWTVLPVGIMLAIIYWTLWENWKILGVKK